MPDATPRCFVVPGLTPLLTRITEVRLDPENARVHSERNVAAIADSLRKFGQRKPIVANRRNCVVLAGNGTMTAAALLGWTHLAVVWVEDDPTTARGYALADNRTAELAEWHHDRLGVLLRELGDEAIGWTIAETRPIIEEGWTPPTAEAMPEPPHRPAAHHGGGVGGHHYAVTADQRRAIDRAIEKIRAGEGDPTIPEGRCLELVAADYLAGR